MKYTSLICAFTLLSVFCVSSFLLGMEDSKAPTDYYELSLALDPEGLDLDDEWVFRAYNGKDPIPPYFNAQQAAAIRGKE
jgi:hypothetical protein